MSTIDQAFVQAFARRNRNKQTATQMPAADVGIQVDPSVSQSTQIWIDPIENTMHRADPATSIPRPSSDAPEAASHIPPHVNQHGHTAYAYATKPANSVAAPAPMPTPAPVPVQTPPPAIGNPAFDPTLPAEHSSQVVHRRFDQPAGQSLRSHREPTAPQAPETTPAANDPKQSVTAKDPLQPIWEVDAFDIPSSIADLFFEERLFELVAKRIHDAVNEGLQSLIVTSTKAGEGRSTIAIGMAMAAAASGLHVALVDGDVEDPTLADDLRLDIEFGWLEAARGGLPLSQIAIYSIEDSVTLIPMMPRPTATTGPSITEVKKLIADLDDQFDLVIIDGPSGDMPLIEQYSAMVDSGIIAWDKSRTDLNTINELSSRMQQAGISGVGIVENFS